jgi:hypothetical protein
LDLIAWELLKSAELADGTAQNRAVLLRDLRTPRVCLFEIRFAGGAGAYGGDALEAILARTTMAIWQKYAFPPIMLQKLADAAPHAFHLLGN